jgi:2-polyprenyl-6-methoxyphenol hydroxylase-like FAD-dependent oxidoreductase
MKVEQHMHASRIDEVPVLIAGAGPAGLTAAIELARHGVESLLVERRAALSALPRATVVSTRSAELLRSWGLEDAVAARAVDVEWVGWVSETLATAAAGAPFPAGLPTREQSAALSPTAPLGVAQDELEPVMLAHLRALGCTRVEFATEVTGVQSAPDGVRAVLRDVGTGASREVRARYLVAADGAHSRVRTALGIGMHGQDELAEVVTALFRAPLWELLGDRRHGIYSVQKPQQTTFLPAGRGDRWLVGVYWDSQRERLEDFTADRFADLIRAGAGAPALRPRIDRIGAFTFAAKLAERFREGSAFLVGDAAHRVTPRGGTGMNTAIHSAHDLGWKLAWVVRGWAGPSLLDSYEAERRPVAEHNVARSADVNGSVREVAEEVHTDLGGRIAHVWLPGTGAAVSTLDLVGQGLTLFTGPRDTAWRSAAARVTGPPVTVRTLDAVTARALGLRPGGALLARPDAVPAGWWADEGAAGSLAEAIATAAGRHHATPGMPDRRAA